MGQYQTRQRRCSRGHPFNEGNTYHLPRGERVCRPCNKIRKRRYLARRRDERLIQRFIRQIQWLESGCWLFQSSQDRFGYTHFSVGGRPRLTHRWAYLYFVGPIPAGLQLDHLCCVPNCVNPDHLEPVTAKENVRRSWAARGVVVKGG